MTTLFQQNESCHVAFIGKSSRKLFAHRVMAQVQDLFDLEQFPCVGALLLGGLSNSGCSNYGYAKWTAQIENHSDLTELVRFSISRFTLKIDQTENRSLLSFFSSFLVEDHP